jgi:phosphate starvation-inducible protein PhoH and related proteins
MDKIIKIHTQEEARLLFGLHDENARAIEKEFKVKITLRGDHLKVSGTNTNINKACAVTEYLLSSIRSGQKQLSKSDLYFALVGFKNEKSGGQGMAGENITRSFNSKQIGPKTKGQREYAEAIKKHDIVFGIGPAGTGKTYLAMASAVDSLKRQEVRRIILTRPAIEAGESLGFLPGDMKEKIAPYLRPLYDALYDMMEAETIEKYLETGIIEVAPLAYMRGRTLNDAFIIMDEAQNATAEQMKMFLTRLGFDSKAVITGDITQSDLPNGRPIGLLQAQDILKDIEGIKIIYLTGADVVRHALVQKIIEAYDQTNYAK